MSTRTSSARQRQVCPICGSADLVEIAFGQREVSVTYYTDGTWDDRTHDEWEVDTWLNRCNACGADLLYDQLVPETTS